jgi:hypothetical protein
MSSNKFFILFRIAFSPDFLGSAHEAQHAAVVVLVFHHFAVGVDYGAGAVPRVVFPLCAEGVEGAVAGMHKGSGVFYQLAEGDAGLIKRIKQNYQG